MVRHLKKFRKHCSKERQIILWHNNKSLITLEHFFCFCSPVQLGVFPERLNKGFELSDDRSTRIAGRTVVDAAHQDQVERTRDLVLVLEDKAGVTVVNATTLKASNKSQFLTESKIEAWNIDNSWSRKWWRDKQSTDKKCKISDASFNN